MSTVKAKAMSNIPKHKVCLVIACYFGKRTNNDIVQNRFFDVHRHFLTKCKHNLAKIVFVVADDNVNKTERKFVGPNDFITYFYKENEGLSFGSWHALVNHYRYAYDYYIFLEDDYIFIVDHFDDIFVNAYKTQHKEYIVNYWATPTKRRLQSISTIGITTPSVINRISNFNPIKWPNTKMECFTHFLKAFKSIGTLPEAHNAFPYWGALNDVPAVYLYGLLENETEEEFRKRAVLCPIQMIDDKYRIQPVNLRNVICSVARKKKYMGEKGVTKHI